LTIESFQLLDIVDLRVCRSLISYSNRYFTDTEHPHNHFDNGAGGAAADASARQKQVVAGNKSA
jgi:hypothetical protein